MIGVIGVMVRRNIIIIFMSIELILNAVNINLVAFSNQLQNVGRPGVRGVRHCGGGGRSGRRPRHHPGVLPEQGNGQHRRDEPDAVVGRIAIGDGRSRRIDHRITIVNRDAYIWLIPLLPGLGAAINGLVGIRSFSRRTAGAAWPARRWRARSALSLVAFLQLLGAARRRARLRRRRRRRGFRRSRSQTARRPSARFQVPWGFRLDPLSGDDAARRHRHRHADPRLLDGLHGRRAARRRTRGSSAT